MTDHACLACGKVHADASEITLHDGSVVSSYSEAWRHEAEARAILAMPKDDRWSFLMLIERKRGKPAAEALKSLVWKLWDLQRGERLSA